MRAMRRLRNRSGVFVVLFGILFVALMAAAAMSIDFARIWVMRNELQTAADAGALAGAVQIGLKPQNTDVQVDSAAKDFISRNKSMGANVVVDSVIIGNWADNGAGWKPLCRVLSGTCVPIPPIPSPVPSKNAIQTFVSHGTNGLIMAALGISAPNVHARAIAWADAPIAEDKCIKPWSIPYVELMYRLNLFRGISPANDPDSLARPFDQTADMQALRDMTPDQRRFTLKLGGGGMIKDSLPGSGYPGNYQAIKLPKMKDGATGQMWPEGDPGNGGNDYRNNINGSTCYSLSPGDWVQVKTGAMAGPTIQGVEDAICGVGQGGLRANGDCLAPDGTVGVPIKAAFHLCTGGCNGATGIGVVKLLGSFTLTKVYPNPDDKASPPITKGQIEGYFNPINATGPVGTVGSTQVKIILVK